ncbi:TPA: hypothetical protein ACPJ12_001622 [Vibrio diabolicus]
MNTNTTSKSVASKAARTLSEPNASKIQKSLATNAMAQASSSKQTYKDMETKASNVLQSNRYSDETKEFAASVLTQSNKKR